MKKQYISPAMTSMEMKTQHFLCGSITERSDYLDVSITGDGEFESGETIN